MRAAFKYSCENFPLIPKQEQQAEHPFLPAGDNTIISPTKVIFGLEKEVLQSAQKSCIGYLHGRYADPVPRAQGPWSRRQRLVCSDKIRNECTSLSQLARRLHVPTECLRSWQAEKGPQGPRFPPVLTVHVIFNSQIKFSCRATSSWSSGPRSQQ